jgi:hypothetical protein
MRKPTSSTQLAAFYLLTHGGMSRTMLCNVALMVRLSNFYSSFKPNFSRIFLFEFQVVRASNRSPIEGPLLFLHQGHDQPKNLRAKQMHANS